MPTELAPGQQAPAFELESDDAGTVRLKDLRGKHVVLYFYPKDDTPGCTVEACAFRDATTEFEREGAVVLGVSLDSVSSHGKFRQKYGLSFPLLSDPDHRVADAYGVYGPKTFMGREYMGVDRATFLIDPEGTLAAVWPKVKPEGHDREVLERLREEKG